MSEMQQQLFEILHSEFSKRKAKNQAYSVRAFARDLQVGTTSLADFFQRKRQLSVRSVMAISRKIALPDNLLEKVSVKGKARSKSRDILNEEKMRMLSEWYYLALLNLAKIKNVSSDVDHLAARLGIDKDKIARAVSDLEKLNMVSTSDNLLVRTSQPIGTSQDVPSQAIRNLHKSFLAKASQSLDGQHVGEREFGIEVMAINPKKMAMAKVLLQEFLDNLSSCMERGERQKVYAFCFQFFNLENN